MARRYIFITSGLAFLAAAVAVKWITPVPGPEEAAVIQAMLLMLTVTAVAHFTLAAAGNGAPLELLLVTAFFGFDMSFRKFVAFAVAGFVLSRYIRLDAGRPEWEERLSQSAGQQQRDQLARQLQDSIRKQVGVMRDEIDAARAGLEDAGGARQALDAAAMSSREALTEIDALLDQFSAAPADPEAFALALERQCRALEIRTGAKVDLSIDMLPEERVHGPLIQEVYRIAQEALANVARHARASRVTVAIAVSKGALDLRVEDDGSGFDPGQTPGGMGLRNMRERAAGIGGSVEIAGTPGRSGTRVSASIPLLKASRWRPDVWHLVLGASLVLLVLAAVRRSIPLATAAVNLLILFFGRNRWREPRPDLVSLDLGGKS